MAWFLNHYECHRCRFEWADEWSCMCDDDCPRCGLNMSPYTSDDLTEIIVPEGGGFVIYCSPDTAGHYPDYREAASVATVEEASRYLAERPASMNFDRITVSPAQMEGIPCIRGLRIPVATLVTMVADGVTEAEILAAYPDLKREDIRQALRYAAEAVRERELPLAAP